MAEKQVVQEVTQQQEAPQQTSETQEADDDLTVEYPEAIGKNKKKEAEAKQKAEAERIEREKREAEEKKTKEEEAKKKEMQELIGGVKKADGTKNTSDGTGNTPGTQGQLDGDPYAPSYFGGSGPGKGGVGFGLKGRGKPTNEIFKQECNEYGLVVVRIEVDKQGKVLKAEPGVQGTTNKASCLLEPAKKIALSFKWPADANAPTRQIGFVSINFDY